MLRLDCLTPKNILQNSENLIQYVWKSNSFGEFLLGIFTYFYSYLTDVLLNKTNGEITCCRSIISHKNLKYYPILIKKSVYILWFWDF